MKKDLELYLHIPFCVSKCKYCDFLSFPVDEKVREEYVEALIREIQNDAKLYQENQVKTIFIGGGTPSILEGNQISRIMDAIRNHYDMAPYVETTIECNPGTLTGWKVDAYLDAGINRMSIGLQSANNNELKALGRIHTTDDFVQSYFMARNGGFSNINIDLIGALPYQTLDSFCNTLHSVAGLSPEHLSVYSLIVEENTPLYDWIHQGNEHTLPGEEVEREMYYRTRDILKEYGYERYEISNYAKKGYECRHNVGYWERADYAGFGLGAASLIQNHRFSNGSDLEAYLKSPGSNKVNEEYLSEEDAMAEFMFLGLRKIKGISIPEFNQTFGKDFFDIYGDITRKLENQKLLVIDHDRAFLTDLGLDVSNQVMAEFLL